MAETYSDFDAVLTVTVDEAGNVCFSQDTDTPWEKIEAAMQAIVARCQQQFKDRAKCPFAPIDEPSHVDWLRPKVRRLEAGSAEGGRGNYPDAGGTQGGS